MKLTYNTGWWLEHTFDKKASEVRSPLFIAWHLIYEAYRDDESFLDYVRAQDSNSPVYKLIGT